MKHLLEYLKFNELSDEAKENAISQKKDQKYESWDGGSWAVDDDSLFEPSDEEMTRLFGADYYEANGNRFMLENNGKDKISFIGYDDPNHHLQCKDAIEVSNENMFFRWLGIPAKYREHTYYTFVDVGSRNPDTSIEFELNGDEEEFIEEFGNMSEIEEVWEHSRKKFEDHIQWVLRRITASIEDQFTDEAIEDDIENDEDTFDEEGYLA